LLLEEEHGVLQGFEFVVVAFRGLMARGVVDFYLAQQEVDGAVDVAEQAFVLFGDDLVGD
jgi:hypothetical protein